MDAARLVITDHKAMTDLLSRLDGDGDASGPSRATVEATIRRLRAHVTVVDELLIPAVRTRAPEDDFDGLEAAQSTTKRIQTLLDELAELNPADPRFGQRVDALQSLVATHIDEEETVVVARAEDLLSDDELIDLGRRMEQRERELTRSFTRWAGDVALPVLRTAALILLAGVALAVLGRLRRPMRTSGPRPMPPA